MNAVVTLCIGDKYDLIANKTHPTIKNYADSIGADFIVINTRLFNEAPTPHWEKFQIYDLLKKYNRIIYMDTDLIVRGDCPNLFDLVPENKLGIFNEGKFDSRLESIREAVMYYKEELNEWDGTYYNTGVMVISRVQRNLFKPPKFMAPMGMYEQGYLNLRIIKDKIPVHDIQYRYNRMTLMDKLTGENRLDSYIVHYAGAPNLGTMHDILDKDIESWKNDKPDYAYSRTIVISVGGGMGDQIDAEPVVRYIREKSYPDTNIIIQTHWPRIYQHFKKYQKTEITSDPVPSKGDAQYWMYTMPDTRDNMWKFMSHPLVHTIDYASMGTLKTILKNEDKQIRLEVTNEDKDEVFELLHNPQEYVAVHVGKGWSSKTFPATWWLEVINELLKNNIKVVVIGKYVSEEQGYQDFNCPEGAVDLRNMLSLGGLFALISMCPILVSNDSAPIHIAGAFNNNIILIPTCKQPHHVLPWRNGEQYYKANSICNELLCDNISSLPTKVYGESIDWVPGGDILKYLPTARDVWSVVDDFLEGDKYETDGVDHNVCK